MYRTLSCLLAVCAAAGATADVVQVAPGGFSLREERIIHPPPAQAYAALLEIGKWWNPQHTYSGRAENLYIEARPGGCFCERLPDGGGVLHMTVVNVQPAKLLRFSGALGPLQSLGVTGSLSWSFAAVPQGTKITLAYSVGGFLPQGFESVAPDVDRVLREQLERLAVFAESGRVPAAANPPPERH